MYTVKCCAHARECSYCNRCGLSCDALTGLCLGDRRVEWKMSKKRDPRELLGAPALQGQPLQLIVWETVETGRPGFQAWLQHQGAVQPQESCFPSLGFFPLSEEEPEAQWSLGPFPLCLFIMQASLSLFQPCVNIGGILASLCSLCTFHWARHRVPTPRSQCALAS